jgi:serine/threonine protein phosphatase PrpC
MLAPEQAERDPRANRITRAVGGSSRLLVDVELFDLAPGDRFLLCSDGLYREVSDRDIAAILVDSGVKQVVENLIDRALTGAARDNITAVVASRSDEKQTGGTDATG